MEKKSTSTIQGSKEKDRLTSLKGVSPITNIPTLICAVDDTIQQEYSLEERDSKGRVLFKDKNGYYIM